MRFLVVILMLAATWVVGKSFEAKPSTKQLRFACQREKEVLNVRKLISGNWVVTCKDGSVRFVPENK